MKAVSLHSREALLQAMHGKAPQLACDFMLEIEMNPLTAAAVTGSTTKLLLSNFSLPEVGVAYTNNSEIGHITPNLQFSTMQISFIILADGSKSPIHKIWESQFIDGTPKFIPYNQLPVVTISRIVSEADTFAEKAKKAWGKTKTTSEISDIIGLFKQSDSEDLNKEPVLTLRGCRFSFPKPQIEYSSDNLAIYSTTISFESFEIN